eukprot:scaffold2824_cov372-Prasinococcus_capsulatus_cf.AAC.7
MSALWVDRLAFRFFEPSFLLLLLVLKVRDTPLQLIHLLESLRQRDLILINRPTTARGQALLVPITLSSRWGRGSTAAIEEVVTRRAVNPILPIPCRYHLRLRAVHNKLSICAKVIRSSPFRRTVHHVPITTSDARQILESKR